jgi:hypothetical protein
MNLDVGRGRVRETTTQWGCHSWALLEVSFCKIVVDDIVDTTCNEALAFVLQLCSWNWHSFVPPPNHVLRIA